MLENEIKNLAAEIKLLREAMTASTIVAEPTTGKATTKVAKATTEAEAAPAPVEEKPTAISIEDLQAVCTTKVRANKSNRVAITTLLATYEATRIGQVAVERFGELLADLNALEG